MFKLHRISVGVDSVELKWGMSKVRHEMQVEVEFDDLARVEAFWAALPAAEHQAWSQRARNFIIDGTPRWEVYRTCRTFSSPQAEAVSSSSTGFPTSASSAADAIIEAWRDQEGMLPPGRDRSHEVCFWP